MKDPKKIKAHERAKLKKLRLKEKEREKKRLKREKDKAEHKHIKKSAIKVAKDGHIYISYKHHKRGFRKKPKRKKPKKNVWIGNNFNRFDYRIVRALNNEQKEYISKHKTLIDAQEKKKELIDQSNGVWFPKNYINNRRESETFIDVKSEYLILERVLDNGSNVTTLPNEYGKYIEHHTTSDKWRIIDKFPCNIEETFYVFGYNYVNDRKTVQWIVNEFIENKIGYNTDIVRLVLYGNKLLFMYDDDFDIVICKNISDGIRLHNFIETKYRKNKQVICSGMAKKYSERAAELAAMIEKKTGWKHTDVIRHDTHK